jgi:hypothetical protein
MCSGSEAVFNATSFDGTEAHPPRNKSMKLASIPLPKELTLPRRSMELPFYATQNTAFGQ